MRSKCKSDGKFKEAVIDGHGLLKKHLHVIALSKDYSRRGANDEKISSMFSCCCALAMVYF